MYVEHEIKLRLSPKAAAKLRRLAALRPLRTGPPVTRRLNSTYFDTPGFGFRDNEMALRVRRIGRRRIQTLKLPGHGALGVQAFHEYEADVQGDRPELKGLGDKTLRARLVRAGLAKGLEPVFVTEFDRHTVPVRVGTSEIELAVDQGEIRAGGRSVPICEAELELRSGRIEDLFKLAMLLHEQVPFSLEGRTKAARGYGLLAGEAPRGQGQAARAAARGNGRPELRCRDAGRPRSPAGKRGGGAGGGRSKASTR
ncbi:MAG: CYTH domain-containing protein [Alphaproteobacteria bacterium]